LDTCSIVPYVKVEYLELSKIKKTELLNFMKGTKNKEEYRRASAVKQKLEGLPYRVLPSYIPGIPDISEYQPVITNQLNVKLWRII